MPGAPSTPRFLRNGWDTTIAPLLIRQLMPAMFGCPTLATSLFLWLGWDTTNPQPGAPSIPRFLRNGRDTTMHILRAGSTKAAPRLPPRARQLAEPFSHQLRNLRAVCRILPSTGAESQLVNRAGKVARRSSSAESDERKWNVTVPYRALRTTARFVAHPLEQGV